MAAVTGGDMTIEGVAPDDLVRSCPAFARLGVAVELGERRVHVPPGQQLVDPGRPRRAIPKVEDGPWPAFPADLTSIAVIVATQAKGTVLIFEKMFESRLFFVDKLVVDGRADHPLRPAPRRRHRPGAALRPADVEPRHPRRHGDGARGALRRGDVDDRRRDQIDKGYERIDERLRALGAAIERVET